MVELADTLGLEPSGRKVVGVQIPPAAVTETLVEPVCVVNVTGHIIPIEPKQISQLITFATQPNERPL